MGSIRLCRGSICDGWFWFNFAGLQELPLQIVARPLPNDILEWHYVLEGSKGIPFEGRDHAILYNMTTPSGRFAPHKRIRLLMSDFHPESWNPMWSVARLTNMGDKL